MNLSYLNHDPEMPRAQRRLRFEVRTLSLSFVGACASYDLALAFAKECVAEECKSFGIFDMHQTPDARRVRVVTPEELGIVEAREGDGGPR